MAARFVGRAFELQGTTTMPSFRRYLSIPAATWVACLALLTSACGGDESPPGSARGGLLGAGTGILPSAEAKDVLSTLRVRFASRAAGVVDPPAVLPQGSAESFQIESDGLRPQFAASAEQASARVLLPKRSTASFHLEDEASGMAIDVSLEGARDAEAQSADGYLVYRQAHVSGATVLHRALPSGTEDFLSFEKRPPTPVVAYQVTLQKGVSGLRLVENTLEILDAGGAPRLRVEPPYLVGADGAQTDATLAVEGCAVDSSPAAPWGRPVTAPRAKICTVRVSWADEAVAYPALLDPRWTTTTGAMVSARQEHTATLLSTGKVLVAGGRSGTGTTGLATAELFDRTTGTWAATGSMTSARRLHSAVQLGTSSSATTSGKVLIAGGVNGSTSLNTGRLYSPTAGTWVAAANLNAPRHEHTATLLANGQVLVAGGMNGSTVLNTAARYNPASGSGSWTAVGNMSSARRAHTATRLVVPGNTTLNNRVLVVGGNSGGTTSVATVQRFDGASAWTTMTALPSTREGHTATALANGNVLVVGGRSGSTTLDATLLFNAASGSGTWSSAGTLTSPRQAHSATLLPASVVANGQVLVAGGSSNGTSSLGSAELWNDTNTWTATSALPAPVRGHTATLLANNAVLIAGGLDSTAPVNLARIHDASFGLSCTTSDQCTTGFCVKPPGSATGVCCNTACTGACEACNNPDSAGTCSPKASGTVCRAATGECDVEEKCTGSSAACPVNVWMTDGLTCSDGNGCTESDTCRDGSCAPGAAVVCPVADDCHEAATCEPATGLCRSGRVADGTPCNDRNICSMGDECRAGTCIPGPTTGCSALGDQYYVPVTNLGSVQGSSYARDITENGMVVVTDSRVDPPHAVIYAGGVLTQGFRWTEEEGRDDLPYGGVDAFPVGINANGVVAGSGVTDGWIQAFRHVPGDAAVELITTAGSGNGVNDAGQVAGSAYYTVEGKPVVRMFRMLGDATEVLPAPLEFTYARAFAIDSAGSVVGDAIIDAVPGHDWFAARYTDARGFENLNDLLPADLPPTEDWYLAHAHGTNGTDIVGWGIHNGLRRAFRLTPGVRVTDLGIPTPMYAPNADNVVLAHDINTAGEIVGAVYDGHPFWPITAFIWVEGKMVALNDLIDPDSGWDLRLAFALNSPRDVNGQPPDPESDPNNRQDYREVVGAGYLNNQPRAFRMRVPNLSPCRPPLDHCYTAKARDLRTGACLETPKENGTACDDGDVCTQSESCQEGSCRAPTAYPLVLDMPVEDLVGLGGTSALAQDINTRGDIVGYSTTASGETHALLWTASGETDDIGLEPGFPAESTAVAISDAGMIAGSLTGADGSHAFRFTVAGGLEDLGLAGDGSVAQDGFNFQGAYAYDINNSGQLAGAFTNASQIRGFRYSPGVGFEDIGSLGGNRTAAAGIDASGRVVGSSRLPSSPTAGFQRLGHAISYDDERGLVDLNSYVDPQLGWTLIHASDITGDYIVGGGEHQGRIKPFRLHLSTRAFESVPFSPQGSMFASGVNRFGDMVGWGYEGVDDTGQFAYAYTDQFGFKKLNEIIDQDSGWDLRLAASINDAREIVGWGYREGELSAFRLSLSFDAIACGAAPTLCGPGSLVCSSSEKLLDNDEPLIVIVSTPGGQVTQNSGEERPTFDHTETDGKHITAYFESLPGQTICEGFTFDVKDPTFFPYATLPHVTVPGVGPGSTFDPATAVASQMSANGQGRTAAGSTPPPCGASCGQVPDASPSEMPQSTAGVSSADVKLNTELIRDGSDPINPMTGEFVYSNVDLELSGVIPFRLTRTYRSRVNYHGPLGYGWNHTYNELVYELQDTNELFYSPGDGTTRRFTLVQFIRDFKPIGDNSPDRGVGQLYFLENSDNRMTMQRWVEADGSVLWVMFDQASANTREFRGRNGRGRLSKISNATPNALTFHWEDEGPHTDWNGQPREPRLSSVVDTAGRTITFAYNDHGQLLSVKDDETQVGASYTYTAIGQLETANDYVGHAERYVYDTPPDPAEADGHYVPQPGIHAACDQLCAPRSGPGGSPENGGACDAVVTAALSTCSSACRTCTAQCNNGCVGSCETGCSTGCGTECLKLCSTPQQKQVIRNTCQQLWDAGGKDSCSESACQDRCDATCGDYCDDVFLCIGFTHDVGGGDGGQGGGVDGAQTAQACEGALNKLEGSLEDIADIFSLGGALIVDGVKCAAKKICFWCDDRNCAANNIREQWADLCNNDCFSCCVYGDECAAGSKNNFHECSADCRQMYFGTTGDNGKCGSDLTTDCWHTCADQPPPGQSKSCTKKCTEDCPAACAASCSSTTCQGCDMCTAALYQVPCEAGCKEQCLANNNAAGPNPGPKYGHKADLANNLKEIYDGGGRRTLSNTYGKVISDPSFDAVLRQTLGASEDEYDLDYRYRDLSVATPTVTSSADVHIADKDEFESVHICPPDDVNPTTTPGFLAPRRFIGGSQHPGAIPFHATVVRDAYRVHWTYYFNIKGQLIATINAATGARRSYEYDAFGRPSGEEDALKGRHCVRRDGSPSGGNDVEIITVLDYPVPTDAWSVPSRRRTVEVQHFPTRVLNEWVGDNRALVRSFGYQGRGSLHTATEDGQTVTYTNDADGLPDFATDDDGIVTQFAFQEGQLSEFTTDAEGPTPSSPQRHLLTYDSLGRLLTRTTPFGETETFTWTGKHMTRRERRGDANSLSATDYDYDADGRVETETTELLVTRYEYDLLGMLRHVWTEPNPSGAYANDSRFITHHCRLYGPGERLLAEVQPEGNRLIYTYDDEGRMRSINQGNSGQDSRTWDDPCANNVDGSLKPVFANILQTQYDANGRQTMLSTPDAGQITAVYNGYAEPAVIYDPRGQEIHTGYDARGRREWIASYSERQPRWSPPVDVTPALIRVEGYGYDGNTLSIVRRWNFDNAHTGDPAIDSFVDAHRDGRQDVVEAFSRLGPHRFERAVQNQVTRFETDGSGRTVRMEHPNGAVETFQYSADDGIQSVEHRWTTNDGVGHVETQRFSACGKPSSRTFNDDGVGLSEVRTYDALGRLASLTRGSGESHSFGYDPLGRPNLSAVVHSGNQLISTAATYNRNGALTDSSVLTSPPANTHYDYDMLGRRWKETTPDQRVTERTFTDASNRPKTVTNANGVHAFEYGRGGLVRSETVRNSLGVVSTRTYAYDAAGRPVQGNNWTPGTAAPGFTTYWLWNSLDQQTLDMVSVIDGTTTGPLANTQAGVFNTYDMYGRKLTTRYYDFYEVGRGYDVLDRLASVADTEDRGGVKFNHTGPWSTVPGIGGPVTREYRNGMLTTFAYDGTGHIRHVVDQARVSDAQGTEIGFNDLADIRWALGSADGLPRAQIARFTPDPSGGAQPWSTAGVYQVDSAGRLTAENYGLVVPPSFAPATNDAVASHIREGNSWRGYLLNATNDWQTRSDPSGDFSPSYLLQNRLSNWRYPGSASPTSLSYTNFGALARKEEPSPLTPGNSIGDETSHYDAFGTSVGFSKLFPRAEGAADVRKVEYRQDAFGRLVYVDNVNDPLGPALYGYDGNQPAMRVLGASGRREAFVAGDELDTYLYRVSSDPSSTYYFHQDRYKNVYMTTYQVASGGPNPANTATGTWPLGFAEYTAYGERSMRNAQGARLPPTQGVNNLGSFTGDMFGFHGLFHWNHGQAQNVHMRNRVYRPEMGRFTSPDPLGPRGGVNPYAYGNSAPLRFEDPFGLSPAATGRSTPAAQQAPRGDIAEAFRRMTMEALDAAGCTSSPCELTESPELLASPLLRMHGNDLQLYKTWELKNGAQVTFGVGAEFAVHVLYAGGTLSAHLLFDTQGNVGLGYGGALRIGPGLGIALGPEVFLGRGTIFDQDTGEGVKMETGGFAELGPLGSYSLSTGNTTHGIEPRIKGRTLGFSALGAIGVEFSKTRVIPLLTAPRHFVICSMGQSCWNTAPTDASLGWIQIVPQR
jgi:RHS repeat-associated protein